MFMLTLFLVVTTVTPMELPLTPTELLTTTRSVRKRLDLERPVSRDEVEECLQVAFQAPNGSNQQMYGWVCVDDADTKAAMATIYREALGGYVAEMNAARDAGDAPPMEVTPARERMTASVMHLNEHLHEVPVLVVPTILGRMEGSSIFDQASRWGSVIPTIWSFMLALRSRGMGSAWTTIHLHREQQMADLLGIPYGRVTQAGLFPVAHTIGTDFRPADRSGSARTIHWNHW